MSSPIQEKNVALVTEDHLLEDEEYREYLALCGVIQGPALGKLTRKIDIRVIPQLVFIYLLSYIDRSNIGNAKLFGAQQDNHLSDADWNTGLTLFFVTFALGAPLCNILVKRFGPKRTLPIFLLLVSIILIGTGVAHSRAQWFSLRLLLGLAEAGIFPGCTYTLTTWYTPVQIQSRTSIYFLGSVLAGAFSGILAFGIGQLDYTWGYRGWRFIYIIEGVFTVLVAIGACFLVYDTPAKVTFLTPEEKRYITLRTKFLYGGNKVASKDDFSWNDIVLAAKSWQVWMVAFCFLCSTMSIYGFSLSLPTIIKNMGFSSANAQILSVPPYIFAAFCTVGAGYVADRYQKRMVNIVVCSIVGFIGLLIAVLTVAHKNLTALSYIATCLIAGGIYPLTPSFVVWIGMNTAGQTKRAAAMSIAIFWGNCGGIVGSNIYLAAEAPTYHSGFGTSLACTGLGCIIVPIIYWYILGRINRKREAISEEEIAAKYTEEELHKMGDLSPLYHYHR